MMRKLLNTMSADDIEKMMEKVRSSVQGLGFERDAVSNIPVTAAVWEMHAVKSGNMSPRRSCERPTLTTAASQDTGSIG